jgi:hypothetical protein
MEKQYLEVLGIARGKIRRAVKSHTPSSDLLPMPAIFIAATLRFLSIKYGV